MIIDLFFHLCINFDIMRVKTSSYDSFWKNLIQFIGDDMCYGIKKVDQVGGMEVRRIGWYTKFE